MNVQVLFSFVLGFFPFVFVGIHCRRSLLHVNLSPIYVKSRAQVHFPFQQAGICSVYVHVRINAHVLRSLYVSSVYFIIICNIIILVVNNLILLKLSHLRFTNDAE